MVDFFAATRRASKNHLVLWRFSFLGWQTVDEYQVFLIALAKHDAGASALDPCNCGNRPRCSIVARTGSSTRLTRACGFPAAATALAWRFDRQGDVRNWIGSPSTDNRSVRTDFSCARRLANKPVCSYHAGSQTAAFFKRAHAPYACTPRGQSSIFSRYSLRIVIADVTAERPGRRESIINVWCSACGA